jgi:hypothetical protein
MNKTYLISLDAVKTIAQGAAGAISFGIYHQYSNDTQLKLIIESKELQQKYLIDKLEAKHNKEIRELKEKINTLEFELKLELELEQRNNQKS